MGQRFAELKELHNKLLCCCLSVSEQRLWPRHVRLCLAMLALESFISFEEIFMLATLQRVDVPTSLLSLPGTISSLAGVFVLPAIGWASDRFTCLPLCGQKRPFAVGTLTVMAVGLSILIGVCVACLYGPDTASGVKGHAVFNFSSNSSSPAPENGSLTVLASNVTNPTTHAENSSGRSAQQSLTALGVLGMAGWTLCDHGYDASASTLKAFIVAVAPAVQHQDIFVMATLLGAVGGCITSLLGFVDLAALFPELGSQSSSVGNATTQQGHVTPPVGLQGVVLDSGVAQCLVQSAVLLMTVILTGACSLLTGSEGSDPDGHDCVQEVCSPPDPSLEIKDTDVDAHNDETKQRAARILSVNATDSSSRSELVSPIKEKKETKQGWLRKRVCLCLMTFFGLCTNYAYFVYVTNYVAHVIYSGDPEADPGTDAYAKYVQGVHIGSLGMLTFYCLFVIFSLLHNRVLKAIGMRLEWVIGSLGCCLMLLSLVVTDNLTVFFLNAVTMSVFRSAVYTIPFVLVNSYSQQELDSRQKTTDNKLERNAGYVLEKIQDTSGDEISSSAGRDMACVSAMVPASYFFVSVLMGPLMDVTGYPALPIMFAAATCLISLVTTFFVQFD